MISELLPALLPAVGLLAVAALAIAVWIATPAPAIAVPRARSVGGRSREHAVLLRSLPDSSHPDAAGHARSRAPGSELPVA
jgi:Family of unknown function (DUF6412)